MTPMIKKILISGSVLAVFLGASLTAVAKANESVDGLRISQASSGASGSGTSSGSGSGISTPFGSGTTTSPYSTTPGSSSGTTTSPYSTTPGSGSGTTSPYSTTPGSGTGTTTSPYSTTPDLARVQRLALTQQSLGRAQAQPPAPTQQRLVLRHRPTVMWLPQHPI